MIMDKETHRLLNESFDRKLTPPEEENLRHALENDPGLKAEAAFLKKIRSAMQSEEASFGPFFSEKVMNRIDIREDYSFEFAFKRVALPGLAAAVILLLITFMAGNSFSLDTLLGVETLRPEYLTEFLLFTN